VVLAVAVLAIHYRQIGNLELGLLIKVFLEEQALTMFPEPMDLELAVVVLVR
jgi:hypothetical protein